MSRLNFKIQAEASGSRARACTFRTLHTEVQTPLFMPVGTHATVRGHQHKELSDLGFSILLANTYHLMLRPGAEVFKKIGGINKFMNWPNSVLTDSGGFQIFSLPNERQMTEQGAIFKSYVTQENILLTPERSIEMQKAIGSDIMMVLDQCIPSTADHKDAVAAMELTHRWAKRSFEARGDSPQSLFGIVQGACFTDLRKISADFLTQMPFDGFAIGGLAVGEGKTLREDMTEFTTDLLPKNLPRYLMGVGTPLDLLEAVHRGVDMFDCIMPTAMGQQGVAFTSVGRLDLRRGAYKIAEEPLDKDCACSTCKLYSKAYLHHLTKVKEALGSQLVGWHNLFFYSKLIREMRQSILNDTFLSFYKAKKEEFAIGDGDYPIKRPTVSKNKKRSRVLGDYEVHESRPGTYSIKHTPSREVMHSVNDPTEEAHALYVTQSALIDKARQEGDRELVVWDVGLGAAINAMATISAYEKSEEKLRPLHLVSFENDLNSLRLASKHKNLFHHLRHAGPEAISSRGKWQHKTLPLKWTLIEGDFLQKIEVSPVPDIIFFDPFSARTDSHAWTYDCFKKIFDICVGHSTELFTYSSSTAVRALLLWAGFHVAKGQGTGPRVETTVALTPEAAVNSRFAILGTDWLEKWERSGAKFPKSLVPETYPLFESAIRSHEQFKSLQLSKNI